MRLYPLKDNYIIKEEQNEENFNSSRIIECKQTLLFEGEIESNMNSKDDDENRPFSIIPL